MSSHTATARRRKGAERERSIISAAIEIMAEHGLSDITLTDIADRAGMSTGHVSYYFPSKASLLMRAIQQSEDGLHREMAQEIQDIEDPWERLSRLVELSASSGRGDRGWVLWFEVWANAAVDPSLAAFQAELDARWRRSLTGVIEYGCARGVFTADDPHAVSTLLSCLVDGLSVHVTLGDAQIDTTVSHDLFMRAANAHLVDHR